MSQIKRAVRSRFRSAVFSRDGDRCRVCGVPDTGSHDAHHITDRSQMPFGGYVAENGICLCPPCHAKAEQYHSTGVPAPGYSPDELYRLVGSSYDQAVLASERLKT